MRNSVLKLAAVALVLMGANSAAVHAGVVTYDFSAPLVGTTTPFSYTVAIPSPNDTGSPNLTATFTGTPFTVQASNGAGAGNGLVGNSNSSTFLQIDFSNLVNLVSISFAFTGPTTTGRSVNLTAYDSLGNPIPSLTQTTVGPVGTVTVGSLSNPLWFSSVQINANGNPANGVLNLDNLLADPVPEIDASSSIGALTLLGSAVMMFRSRRPKTAKV